MPRKRKTPEKTETPEESQPQEAEPSVPQQPIELKIDEELWLDFLKLLRGCSDEVTFYVNGESVSVKEINESRTALVVGSITGNGKPTGEKPITFRTKILPLGRLIKRLRYVGDLYLILDGSDIYVTNGSDKRFKLENLVEETTPFDDEMLEKIKVNVEPKLNVTAKQVDFSEFHSDYNALFKDLPESDQPNALRFIAHNGKLRLEAYNHIRRMETTVSTDVQGEGKCALSHDLLSNLSGRWDMRFGTDIPAILERETKDTHVQFIVAPRIEVE